MKFCKDCYWARPEVTRGWFSRREDYTYAKCAHSSNSKETMLDPVSGKPVRHKMNYCRTERQFDCGEDAKFFQAKPEGGG